MKLTSIAALNPSTSYVPSSSRKLSRLRLARLHAELSMCMYSEQGLLALMRSVLGAVCHLLMVVSNCMPGSAHSQAALAIWPEQVPGLDGLQDLAGGDGPQLPVAVVEDGLHELVGDPDRVVGVLVLDRVAVLAVEVHVEAGVAKRPGLALLDGLAPDEVLDVGMVGVEDDHLGRPAGLAARLDGARRRVGASHEADRPRGGAAAPQTLLGGTDLGQVDPGPDPPLKMMPSSMYQLRIESIESSTARMKQADAC